MIVLQHRTHYTERCIEVRPLSVRQIGICLFVFLLDFIHFCDKFF